MFVRSRFRQLFCPIRRYAKISAFSNSSENFVNCTTIDIGGNIRAMSEPLPKMELIKNLSLYPRDLRKIDQTSIDIVPTIAVRKHCILVNLLHIKAIVLKDCIKIFDTSDRQSVRKIGLFVYELQDKLKMNAHHNTVFEFRAIETILVNVMSVLESELKIHVDRCSRTLKELETQIDRIKLRDLLIYSKGLSKYCQKAQLIRDVLDELLDTDEDLEGMYLTSGKQSDTSEIEILLENYYKQCDEFVQHASSLMNDIKSTEDVVNMILDSSRNSMMIYDLKITIYTLGFTVATVIPAFYGMNLKNYIEESELGFTLVVATSIISAGFVTAFNFKKLKQLQRKTMSMQSNGATDLFADREKTIAKHVNQMNTKWGNDLRKRWWKKDIKRREIHQDWNNDWRKEWQSDLAKRSLWYKLRWSRWAWWRRTRKQDPRSKAKAWRWLVDCRNSK